MNYYNITVLFLVFICGIKAEPETFIINGTNAPVHPSHVNIVYRNDDNLGSFGGGTIISPTYVLTAGHMIHTFVNWTIGFGSNNVNNLITIIVNETNALLHPQYNSTFRYNDVGILTLPEPLALSANVRPIALPPLNLETPFTNEQGYFHGFGWLTSDNPSQSTFLQRTYQRVVAHERCALTFVIEEQLSFCTIDTVFSSHICITDLGGGFIVQIRGVDTIVGIASITSQTCGAEPLAAFSNISNSRAWIREVTGL